MFYAVLEFCSYKFLSLFLVYLDNIELWTVGVIIVVDVYLIIYSLLYYGVNVFFCIKILFFANRSLGTIYVQFCAS